MSKTIHKVKMEKGNRQIYLPTTSYMDFFKNNYTIIYPNGGSKEHPANVVNNKMYTEHNPFPGYIIHCVPELCYLEEWVDPNYMQTVANNVWYSYGIRAVQQDDGDIKIITGSYCLVLSEQHRYIAQGYTYSNALPNSAHIFELPCRVKVWKVGVIE